MRFRRQPDSDRPSGVVAVPQPNGMFLAGDHDEVVSVVNQLLEVAGSGAQAFRLQTLADVGMAATTAASVLSTLGQYLRLTPRSMEILARYGPSGTGNGAVWGVVRDGGRIVKHLDFQQVNLGPEAIMSLQTQAVAFALRAAIKEVQAAVERVEGKLDDVLSLMRAERVGDVLGTRRVLEPLVHRVRHQGKLSTTDWTAISDLGSSIARDVESLRAYIRTKLELADGGWRPGERADEAGELFEKKGLLTESLALLIVAEDNLALWHELRIANVRINESDHLQWTLQDAQATIELHSQQDQKILDALRLAVDRLTTPTALDGLAPWQRSEFAEARTRLTDLAAWFSGQRMLEFVPVEDARYPSVSESLTHVRRTVSELAGRSREAVMKRWPGSDDDEALRQLPNPSDAPDA